MTAPHQTSVFRHVHRMLFGLALCLVAAFFLAGKGFQRSVEASYNSERLFNALQVFERAIVPARPGEPDSPITADSLKTGFPCVDAAQREQLAGQFQAIQAKLRALGRERGRALRLNLAHWPAPEAGCADAIEMVAWLSQGKRLENAMHWPGLAKATTPVMQVPDSVFRRDNPWRGADGCVYLGPDREGRLFYLAERRDQKDTCPAMAPPEFAKIPQRIEGIARGKGEPHQRYALAADDSAWAIPEDLGVILSDLGTLRRPEGGLYDYLTQDQAQPDGTAAAEQKIHGPNRLALKSRSIDVGFSAYLSLDPVAQSLIQRWTRCYTGDAHACRVAGLGTGDPLAGLAGEMYESAPVRMAGVALIDVATGRIEALGSAHTDCFRQDHAGLAHADDCPDAPFKPRHDPDGLLNHAVYLDALPASTVKPVMALGFLTDNPIFRDGPGLAALQRDLKLSNSEAFLDRLFCMPNQREAWNFRDCQRPQRVQVAARQLGWNLECAANEFSPDCGKLDLLFGRPAGKRLVEGLHRQPLSAPMLYGRFFVESGAHVAAAEPAESGEALLSAPGGFRLLDDFRFNPEFVQACRASEWSHCRGNGGFLVSAGWGQGESRATAVGVAGMLARLAGAANGMKAQRLPHLLDHIGDAAGQPVPLALERLTAAAPIESDPALANLVLRGMTSHASAVVDGATGTAHSACRNVFGKAASCDAIDWIAGKTGTPPFGLDQTTLPQIQKICPPGAAKVRDSRCYERPYKWYVAAFKTRSESGAPYDKAIAVLTERNWRRKTQLVQAPADKEVNLSAELAFRIMKALHAAPAPQRREKP